MRSWANEPLFLWIVSLSYFLTAVGVVRAVGGRRAAWAGGLSAALGAVGVYGFGPWLPATWMTSMREWHTVDRLRLVVGEGSQAGPLLAGFWLPLLTPETVTYPDLIAVDLGATLAACVPLGWAAWRLAGASGLLVVAAWATSPIGVVTALSETEAALVAAHLGPLVAAGWLAAGDGPRQVRQGAVLVVLGLALPVVLLRLELAVFVVGALLGALRPWVGEERWTRWVDGVDAWTWLGVGVVGAWAATLLPVPGEALAASLGDVGHLGWLAQSVDPLNTRWLALPALVAAVASAGLVAAALVGAWDGVRRPLRTGLVAPGLLLAWGTWWLAAHGAARGLPSLVSPWEIVRYASLAMPVVVLLAARGLRRTQGTTRALLTLSLLLPPVPDLIGALRPEHAERAGAPDVSLAGLFAHDQAREVRFLVERARAEPRCAILTKGRPWGGMREDRALVWVAALPTGPGVRFREGGPGDLEAGLALVPDAPCVDLYLSLDCGAEDVEGCDWADDVTERQTWDHRPFLHRQHGQTFTGDAVIGVVRVR